VTFDNESVPDGITPRGRLSRLSLLSRVAAAALFLAAFVFEGHGIWWIIGAIALGVVLIALSWRGKAAVVPGSAFASSADYCPDANRLGTFPGELSITTSGLMWSPSKYSSGKGLRPVSLLTGECQSVSMQAGSALLDVVITVRGRTGSEWSFLTHRSPGLRRAIAGLQDSIPGDVTATSAQGA
jgi:hypothetical protein